MREPIATAVVTVAWGVGAYLALRAAAGPHYRGKHRARWWTPARRRMRTV